ncbi:FUN14 domain-containing protein 1-like [Actinia tenebrosa]|uniref:FUN14 domain-containing protein 1-like n=1 Tax=Actinia tenebrosa TaxID=6105 RepID=A0A6P8H7P8_ACTTE|nr:FUN14 domain-containing protein 1-like [Actinia tenebrosa]
MSGDPEEESDEAYEVIETPGTANHDLFSDIISMDLSNRTPLQQIGIGGVSGWCLGYLCKRVGKLTLSAIGGGLLIIQIANRTGYIKINWSKVERDVNEVSKGVEKEVYKIAKGKNDDNKVVEWTKRGISYAQRNMAAAGGFAAGFLLGVAL